MSKSDKKSSKKTKNKNVSTQETKKTPAAKGGFSPKMQAAIIVLIVVLALSTIGSAIASVFSGSSTSTAEVDTTEEETSSEEETQDDQDSAEDEQNEQSDEISEFNQIEEDYAPYIASLESKYQEDPDDLSTLLSLGRTTHELANDLASTLSGTEETEETEALYERISVLFSQAIDYYESYLEQEDSNAVRVNVAICNYALNNNDLAQSELESIVTEDPDYALAWLYLGYIYELNGNIDEATNAYETAIEKDPDDAYGAQSHAQELLDALTGDEDGDEVTQELE